MKLSTLEEWLQYIASIHHKSMDLGLDRVKAVAQRLGVLQINCPVITVGGTNGKGSTVAGLEAIYRVAGYKTGCFTTPYLFKHNEQVRINGSNAADEIFMAAFIQVEAARGDTLLTQFEFNTLAALKIFQQQALDVVILEVGLGGRLDAVNIIDADLAIVTTVSIDHVEWLGTTREAIGAEKAGIFRSSRPAICGDPGPPESLLAYAHKIGADLYCLGRDFQYQENGVWQWQSRLGKNFSDLPINSLPTQNMATVLMVITLMQSNLLVDASAIYAGLKNLSLPGRMQIFPGAVTEIYDVAHNEESIALLAQRLAQMPCAGKTYAVFSMLRDKDLQACLGSMKSLLDYWFVAPLRYERRTELATLQQEFAKQQISAVSFFDSIADACRNCRTHARAGDRILIFGSFHTVAEAQQAKQI